MSRMFRRAWGRFVWLLACNNGRCSLLWTLTLVVGIFALVRGHGPPILSSTLEDGVVSMQRSHYNEDLYATWDSFQETRARAKGLPVTQPHAEANLFWGWMHWRLFGWFIIAALLYTPIAFREEFVDTWDDLVLRHRNAEAADSADPSQSSQDDQTQTTSSSSSSNPMWDNIRLEIVAEVAVELMKSIWHSVAHARR